MGTRSGTPAPSTGRQWVYLREQPGHWKGHSLRRIGASSRPRTSHQRHANSNISKGPAMPVRGSGIVFSPRYFMAMLLSCGKRWLRS